jgi:hypothetical protein
VIFRRKRGDADADDESDAYVEEESDDEFEELESSRPRGPWDRSETDTDTTDPSYIDLGGIIVKGAPDLELRLQVDEQAQEVSSVLLAGPQAGVELRAFAAPRHDGIWDEVRHDIAAEAAKRGGTATETDGEFGVELKLVVPIQTPDGRQATQTSRIVGVDGPRWLLRGTFLGKSATDPDPDGVVESAFRDVIVVRGDTAMAPRDLIPMRVPQAQAQPADEPAAHDDAGIEVDAEAEADDPYRTD